MVGQNISFSTGHGWAAAMNSIRPAHLKVSLVNQYKIGIFNNCVDSLSRIKISTFCKKGCGTALDFDPLATKQQPFLVVSQKEPRQGILTEGMDHYV
jgi:hypothetical protein